MLGRRKALKTGRGLRGAGRAVASKPRISHGQGKETLQNHRVLMPAVAAGKARGHRHGGGRHPTRVRDGGMVMTQGVSCDTTHLNPGLFFHVAGVVLGLAAAVNSLALAGRGAVIDRARRGSLPVLHLDEGGRTGQRGRRDGNRHQKRRRDEWGQGTRKKGRKIKIVVVTRKWRNGGLSS